MTPKTILSSITANSMVQAVLNLIRGGSLHLHQGNRPATCSSTAFSKPLVIVSFEGAEFSIQPEGAVSITNIQETEAMNSGTATWMRVVSQTGSPVMDGSVGTTNANCILNDTEIRAGAKVTIGEFTFAIPTK